MSYMVYGVLVLGVPKSNSLSKIGVLGVPKSKSMTKIGVLGVAKSYFFFRDRVVLIHV